MTETNTDDAVTTTIDTSLLRGLEPIMSPPEQAQLTALLTSGNSNDLASAAQIFNTLSSLVKSGTLVHQRTAADAQALEGSFRAEYKPSTKKDTKASFNNYESRVRKEKINYDAEQRRASNNNNILPLPVRMPRLVIIDRFDPDGTLVARRKLLGGGTKLQKPSLVFVDAEWDGTLGHAFTKLTVKKERPNLMEHGVRSAIRSLRDSTGVEVHVVGERQLDKGMLAYAELLEGGYDAKLLEDGHSEAQVLIADSHNDAAQLGLHRGDIVTHINGEEVRGMTADEMNLLIKAQFADGSSEESGKLEVVVNAELAVAEALRLRSLGQ